MSTRMRRRRLHRVAAVCAVLLAACGSRDILVPDRAEPGLYVVLYPGDDVHADAYGQGEQYALLLTTGTPLNTDYRSAERFAMTRISDGAQFDWQALDRTGSAPFTYSDADFRDGNYVLPRDGPPPLLGADSLRPGDSYRLDVVTGGVAIQGQLTIPERPVVTVTTEAGRTVVAWHPTRGAIAYDATYDGGPGWFVASRLIRDTVLVLPEGAPDTGTVWVSAYDSNLAHYLLDEDLGRAGLDNGFGVFGAITSIRTQIR